MVRPASRGWTMLEVAVALALVGSMALLGLRNAAYARILVNETAVPLRMRSIQLAQDTYRLSGRSDADGNGIGEYGLMHQLLKSGVLDFGTFSGTFLESGGYLYAVWLPARGGGGVSDAAPESLGAPLDVEDAERRWRCYAWPQQAGVTGRLAYYVDQHGDVRSFVNRE